MATLNYANGTQRRYEGAWPSGAFTLFNKWDFSLLGASASDVVQMLVVPAETFVFKVIHIVKTPEGGTSTGTVGDGDDADGWIASVDNNASAGTALQSNGKFTLSEGTPNTISYTHAYGAQGGKYYADEDTIDIDLSANAVDTAVITVMAFAIEVGI